MVLLEIASHARPLYTSERGRRHPPRPQPASRAVAGMHNIALLFFLVFLPAVPSAAAAQVHLLGQVVDDVTGAPVAGARVTLLDQFGVRFATRTTDTDGEFEIFVRRQGRYFLRASSLGYRETTAPALPLGAHDLMRVELRMRADAVLLAPLEVVARSASRTSPVLASYQARLQAGVGTFIVREEIERIRPGRVSDILETVPGIRLEASGGPGHSRIAFMARAAQCPALIFVDGFLLTRGPVTMSVDDAVSPLSVEAIEVFRGTSTIPAEFLTPQSGCGVIAVWTRRGG